MPAAKTQKQGAASITVAGENGIVSGMAGRYATALFELALETNSVEQVQSDLKGFDALVAENPDDAKNLYAMANLYEKFGRIPEAEELYKKIAEINPNDPKACGALAAFYNKPLWEGKSKFDQAIATLERCASLDPNDAGGYQKIASFYWDKAYRDPLLSDDLKSQYAEKGLENVDKALKIKPDYFEGIIYKGLLYRVKAGVTKNPRERQQFLDEAQTLQKQGLELKKQQAQEQASAAAAAAAAGSPSPGH